MSAAFGDDGFGGELAHLELRAAWRRPSTSACRPEWPMYLLRGNTGLPSFCAP